MIGDRVPERLTGVVTSVRARAIGTTLAAAATTGDSTLVVVDNADIFPDASLRLTDPETNTTSLVVAVSVGDLTTVTLAAPLAAGWPVGTIVAIDPAATEVTAFVRLTDDTEPVPCTVEHGIVAAMTIGSRDETTAETVAVQRVDGALQVVDVIARKPTIDGDLVVIAADSISTEKITGNGPGGSGNVNFGNASVSAVGFGTDGDVDCNNLYAAGPGGNVNATGDVLANGLGSFNGGVTTIGQVHGNNLFSDSRPSTVNAANCYMRPGDGQLMLSSSSRRYKDKIKPARIDVRNVLALVPKSFISNIDGDSGAHKVGFIAEEAHDLGLDDWVGFNDDGAPETFDYSGWVVVLHGVVRDQQQKIDDLASRLAALESRLT